MGELYDSDGPVLSARRRGIVGLTPDLGQEFADDVDVEPARSSSQ
jgi:hypothetical protein